MNKNVLFRPLRADELARGYAVLVDNIDSQLERAGAPQPLPTLELFEDRQERGRNYGLFVEGRLNTVLSLEDLPPRRNLQADPADYPAMLAEVSY